MELQTAQKNFASHGVFGMVLVGIGIASLLDATYRRMTESVQEIWLVEVGAGFIAILFGLLFFGSAVRYLVHMDRIAEYSERKARRRSTEEGRTRRRRPNLEAAAHQDASAQSLEGVQLTAVKSGTR